MSKRSAQATREGKGEARRCELCNCHVAGDWDVHARGIKHRRQLASVQLHGEPGHQVVSVFESLPQRFGGTSYRGKDPLFHQHHSGTSTASTAGSRNRPEPRKEQTSPATSNLPVTLESTRQLALRELAHHAGVGPVYKRASERFATAELDWGLQELQLVAGAAAAGITVAPAHQHVINSNHAGALVAYTTFLLQHEHSPQHQQQPQQPQPPTQPSHQQQATNTAPPPPPPPLSILVLQDLPLTFGAEGAACTCALTCCVRQLARCSLLHAVHLRWSRSTFFDIMRQGGKQLERMTPLWRRVMAALLQVVQESYWLQEVHISCPPGVLAPDDVASLLQAAPRVHVQRRMAVMLGTHARVGSSCCLRALPTEVLMKILDAAMPAKACQVSIETKEWMPGEEGETSGEDDDDDSSDDSDSSDESSESSSDDGE